MSEQQIFGPVKLSPNGGGGGGVRVFLSEDVLKQAGFDAGAAVFLETSDDGVRLVDTGTADLRTAGDINE